METLLSIKRVLVRLGKIRWLFDFPAVHRKVVVVFLVIYVTPMAGHLVLGRFEENQFVSWLQKWNLFETLNVFEYVFLAEHMLLFYALLIVLAAFTHNANRVSVAAFAGLNLLTLSVSRIFSINGQAAGYANYQTMIAVVMIVDLIVSWMWEAAKREQEK